MPVSLFDKRFDNLKFIPMLNCSKGLLIQNVPQFVDTLELYPVTKTIFN